MGLPSEFTPFIVCFKTADSTEKSVVGKYAHVKYLKSEKAEMRASGWHVYELRHSDDGSEYFCTIEPRVICNSSGTFICREELPFNKDGNEDYLELTEETGFYEE